jgi:hypothetical protein
MARRTLIDADGPNMPLLYALRNDLGLHGARASDAVSERCSPR